MIDNQQSPLLRAIRAITGLEQREVATAAAVSERALRMLERGEGGGDKVATKLLDYYRTVHRVHLHADRYPLMIVVDSPE